MNLEVTAIRNVTFYMAAGPVECCDRCSTGIRYVYLVTYKDGCSQKYGSECIKKILENTPTLITLFNKNATLLKKYQDYLKILSGPVEDMPRGREYYNSGKYFIADSKGKDISFNLHFLFHPDVDQEKNSAARHYVTTDYNEFRIKHLKDISIDLPKIQAEITRLEAFLAKILRNAKV